jgi:hypothetical protein
LHGALVTWAIAVTSAGGGSTAISIPHGAYIRVTVLVVRVCCYRSAALGVAHLPDLGVTAAIAQRSCIRRTAFLILDSTLVARTFRRSDFLACVSLRSRDFDLFVGPKDLRFFFRHALPFQKREALLSIRRLQFKLQGFHWA